MEAKKHFKLFKTGRRWCVAAIAMLSVMAIGTTTNADVANKDDASVVMTTQSGNNSNQHSEIADNSAVAVSNTSTEQSQTNAATNQSTVVTNTQGDPEVTQGDAKQTTTGVTTVHAAATPSTPQNGWINENNQWTYYTNGKVQAGRNYVNLPTINGQGNSWYLVNNGVAQSGVQKWAGTYYYFDPTTYLRVDNNYVQSQWGNWYMFGQDGRIASRVYKWANTYYYFDPVTYLRVDNDYRQSQWGELVPIWPGWPNSNRCPSLDGIGLLLRSSDLSTGQ